MNNFCSTGGAYSNSTATPDHTKGSYWSGGPYNNRWFKFQAITNTVTIQIDVNGSGETMRYPMVALWNVSNLTNSIACVNQAGYGNGANNITLTSSSLSVGTWYYISVDNYTTWGSSGTFDICINNASSVQYYAIAPGDWNSTSTWSTTRTGGSPAGTITSLANVVNNQDIDVSVTSAQSCAQLNITSTSTNTSLTIDNATLTVNGTFNQNNGLNNDVTTTVQNSGILTISNNASFNRTGGNKTCNLYLNNATMSVGQDMVWISTAGSSKTNDMTMNNSSVMIINRDLVYNYIGGMGINHTINNSGVLNIKRDINITYSAAGFVGITLNSSATLNLVRNIVRGTPAYGSLICNGSSTVVLNGSSNSQIFPPSAGASGDGLTFNNVTINNTNIGSPQVTFGGASTINVTLTLTNGIIQTTSSNILTLNNGAITTIGSINSYINGPLNYIVSNSGFSIINLPIGKSGYWRPAVLTVNHSNSTAVTYTAEVFNTSASSFGYSLPGTVNKVSYVRYWQIDRQSIANLNNATVKLYYGSDDMVTDYANLTVCKTIGAATSWYDVGGAATGNNSGNILSGTFTSFSKYTIGNEVGGTNLPVNLTSFDAKLLNNYAGLNWSTTSETNNNYFTLEKSKDGINWDYFANIKSIGNSIDLKNYEEKDFSPYIGTNYYRLSQTDFNGKTQIKGSRSVVNNFSNTEIKVYPNPAKDLINISFNGYNNSKIKLTNLLGNIIYSESLESTNENNIKSLDLSGISKGIYFIEIISDKGKFTQKIIKE